MKSETKTITAPAVPWRKRILKQIDSLAQQLARGYLAFALPYWRWRAMRNRDRLAKSYVAVVGSCGKSTTTMLTSRLIDGQRSVQGGLFNNTERHALRTLRRLDRAVDYVVQEVSEFPLGTIAKVMRAMRPDCGIITSAGLDHLTEFRSVDAVAAELSTLSRSCPIICLNADDRNVLALADSATGRVVTFGTVAVADVRAENVSSTLPGRLRFDLVIAGERRSVQTRFVGTIMLTNVLGALAAIHALGLDIDRAIAKLAETEPARGRMSIHEGSGPHTIVLDTVKAPLWSARLVVDDLPRMTAGRRVFVLGSLSDTGSGSSSTRYRQLLQAALPHCDLVIGTAGAAGTAKRLAERLQTDRIVAADTLTQAAGVLAHRPAAMVVVKGNALSKQIESFLKTLQTGASSAPPQVGEKIPVDPI